VAGLNHDQDYNDDLSDSDGSVGSPEAQTPSPKHDTGLPPRGNGGRSVGSLDTPASSTIMVTVPVRATNTRFEAAFQDWCNIRVFLSLFIDIGRLDVNRAIN
jgi:hypothetical protein